MADEATKRKDNLTDEVALVRQSRVRLAPCPFFLRLESVYDMIEYIKAQKEVNEAIISGKFTSDELQRFSKSDSRWIANKGKGYRTGKVRKGEIYQFEFGKNYVPEMSYEHRGLVIGVKDKLLYILPIYSYDPTKHHDVYHPVDYPSSKADLYLLKNSEFSWINHDSVLKLNDIRTVSINRILYQHKGGRIAPTTDTYKCIERLVLKKYFAEFYFEFETAQKRIVELNEDNAQLKEKIEILEDENKKLIEKVEAAKDNKVSAQQTTPVGAIDNN